MHWGKGERREKKKRMTMTMRKGGCRGIRARGRRSVGRGNKTKRREEASEKLKGLVRGRFQEKKKVASGKGGAGGNDVEKTQREKERRAKLQENEKKDVGIQEKWEDVLSRRNYDGFAVLPFMI